MTMGVCQFLPNEQDELCPFKFGLSCGGTNGRRKQTRRKQKQGHRLHVWGLLMGRGARAPGTGDANWREVGGLWEGREPRGVERSFRCRWGGTR